MGSSFAVLTESSYSIAMLILRVAIGGMIITHGYQKVFLGGKIEGTAGWFTSMGMTGDGKMHAWAAAVTEMGSGVLLVLGLLTPFAAAGLVGVMVVAAWTHHDKWFVFKDGCEYNVVVAAVAIAVGTLGAGKWSIDRAFKIDDNLSGWTGFLIAAVLGIGAGVAQLAIFYRPAPASSES